MEIGSFQFWLLDESAACHPKQCLGHIGYARPDADDFGALNDFAAAVVPVWLYISQGLGSRTGGSSTPSCGMIFTRISHSVILCYHGSSTCTPAQDSWRQSVTLPDLESSTHSFNGLPLNNMHPFTAYALGVAVVGLVVYAVVDAVGKYDKRYNVQNMPGPWQLPWIGRIHDLPIEFMWLKFKEWADIHGPIYRTKMLGANFIIISDEKIAEDMLVKKAKLYSDRPEIKSLFDAKSTYGSMEYLPLMGKNRKFAGDP